MLKRRIYCKNLKSGAEKVNLFDSELCGSNTSVGARGGTRTPTPERTTDFKSVASTIPPHGH